MKKRFLIISARENISALACLFDSLTEGELEFCVWTGDEISTQEFSAFDIKCSALPGPAELASKLLPWPVASQIALVSALSALWRTKKAENLSGLVIIGNEGKKAFSQAARLLKIKCLWIETPDSCRRSWPAWKKKLGKRCDIITFNDSCAHLLREIIASEKIYSLPLAIKNCAKRQENIFTELVTQQGRDRKKFFTIGTYLPELEDISGTEKLFHSALAALEILPNLQIVIIGEGEAKKSLLWAAKKLGLEHMVWFVGRQRHLKKWLDNMDLFALTSTSPGFEEIKAILEAAEASVPSLVPAGSIMSDYVEDRLSGFVCSLEDDSISEAIISLAQNPQLKSELGRAAKEHNSSRHAAALVALTARPLFN